MQNTKTKNNNTGIELKIFLKIYNVFNLIVKSLEL